MLAFLILFCQYNIYPYISRVSQIARSYWYYFAFYSLLYLHPSLGHSYSCSQILVLPICSQISSLVPPDSALALPWLSDYLYDLSVWGGCHQTFWTCRQTRMICSYKHCLSVTFSLDFSFAVDFRCMRSLTCFTVRPVININIFLWLFYHGGLDSPVAWKIARSMRVTAIWCFRERQSGWFCVTSQVVL